METKKMAFAGSWYPSDEKACEASIKEFLKDKQGPLSPETGRPFVGGIVPHAGWYFSGSIACRVIASLSSDQAENDVPQNRVDTIILFGAHMHQQSEPFILSHGAVDTPFGSIEVDQELTESICDSISVRKRSSAQFPDENTFELQYPFIKFFFPKARIVVCGAAPSNFASVIGTMAVEEAEKHSRNIRVIGSTDMTHYGPDFGMVPAGTGEKAVAWVTSENDRNGVAALLKMDESGIITQGLDHKNMCCAGAAAATAAACKKLGSGFAQQLDYATSFEKSRGDSFVGYAGVLYS